jgi:ribosomal-protein-serine acetyltransferase
MFPIDPIVAPLKGPRPHIGDAAPDVLQGRDRRARGLALRQNLSVVKLPETVQTPRLLLRRWLLDDAPLMSAAVDESLDHLRPWMDWASEGPLSAEARLELIRGFEHDWNAGGDAVYGAFLDDVVVGGCGLHRRRGPSVLEIGYWVRVNHLRRGFATEMAAGLVDAAFTVEGVHRVEIHHDRANIASRGVPTALGFTFVGEQPNERRAPADEGIDWVWVMHRSEWTRPRMHHDH